MSEAKKMQVAQGEFELSRNPADDSLQAWDAADEFLLDHLHNLKLLGRDSRILILNDAFGALAVALADYQPFSWNDSFLAQQALRTNLRASGYPDDQVQVNRGIDFPSVELDFVVIKIPRMLALLEHQLYQLRGLLGDDTKIIGAGMARHIHRSTLELFETIIGPTTTTRAHKKSRLVMAERDRSLNQGRSPFPDSYELEVDRSYTIINHASLFSRDRLDQGTRLMIENIPASENYRSIVDLGCGSGVIGLVAAAMNPGASLLFRDESYMAIASAETNFRAAHGSDRKAQFMVGDCLQEVPDESQDLVLVNPPFHQNNTRGDAIAWRMFKDARRVLVKSGELCLVGNRHLGYHAKLRKLFGNCEPMAANNKFVLLRSRK